MNNDILRYLPHRRPFIMIDTVRLDAAGVGHSSFKILPGNILVDDGFFSAAGLVENMAQTAGAATVLKSLETGGKPGPTIGYIGAVKDLQLFRCPRIRETLDTTVTFVHQVMSALIVQGTVFRNGELIATCELKIFLQ